MKIVKFGTVNRTGNSLSVVIPAVFVNKAGVKPGDKVKVEVSVLEGKISYTFLNVRQLPLV